MKDKTNKDIKYEDGDIIRFKDNPKFWCVYKNCYGLSVKEIEEMVNREVHSIEKEKIIFIKKYISEDLKDGKR